MRMWSLTSCWAVCASDTLRGFAGGTDGSFVEPDGSRSSSRLASRPSSLWFSWIASMLRSIADWCCCRCGRLEFARRSATRFTQRRMTVSGHRPATNHALLRTWPSRCSCDQQSRFGRDRREVCESVSLSIFRPLRTIAGKDSPRRHGEERRRNSTQGRQDARAQRQMSFQISLFASLRLAPWRLPPPPLRASVSPW